MGVIGFIKNAWNLFTNRDPTAGSSPYGYYRNTYPYYTDRTIITSIYNRLSIDVSQIDLMHVELDKNKRYSDGMNSELNECLTLYANKDQNIRDFIQDIVLGMFDEGVVAVVPVDIETMKNGEFDVISMRTGKIVEWKTNEILVDIYNDNTGAREMIWVNKATTAVISNPFYRVMNEPNSTLQRLRRKLALLDMTDEKNSSGKLNLLVKLPYAIKSKTRRNAAEERKASIEEQLENSKYGIAYIDETESVTQLNRPLDNNLMDQVKYLQDMLFSELGLTQEIMNGTADENTMINYYNRTIEPIISAIVLAFNKAFLSRQQREKEQIMYFRDPFKLIPVTQIADLSDKLTRNEIATSNEIRQKIGWKPSKDPNADELRNKNLSQSSKSINKSHVDNPTDGDTPDEDKYKSKRMPLKISKGGKQ